MLHLEICFLIVKHDSSFFDMKRLACFHMSQKSQRIIAEIL